MVRESNGGARPAQYTMQFKRLAAISLILSPQELSKILLARSRVAVAKVDELTEWASDYSTFRRGADA